MLALNSRHTVSDVATPDLVGPLYCKLTIQVVRDIRPFNGGLLVSVRTWLLTDQPQLAHKASNLEATDDSAFLAEQAFDCPAAGGTAALGKQAVYLSPQGHTLHINVVPPMAVLIIAGAADIKRIADHFNRHSLTQLVYQRVRFMSSDIKRAVVFFSMSFSCSRRLQRASSS